MLAWYHSSLNDLIHREDFKAKWEYFSDTNRRRAISLDGFCGKEVHLIQEFEIPTIIKNLAMLSISLPVFTFWQNFEKKLVTAPKSHKDAFFYNGKPIIA